MHINHSHWSGTFFKNSRPFDVLFRVSMLSWQSQFLCYFMECYRNRWANNKTVDLNISTSLASQQWAIAFSVISTIHTFIGKMNWSDIKRMSFQSERIITARKTIWELCRREKRITFELTLCYFSVCCSSIYSSRSLWKQKQYHRHNARAKKPFSLEIVWTVLNMMLTVLNVFIICSCHRFINSSM